MPVLGEVKQFTGINSPYGPPEKPELIVETGKLTLEESVEQVMKLLEARGVVGTSKKVLDK